MVRCRQKPSMWRFGRRCGGFVLGAVLSCAAIGAETQQADSSDVTITETVDLADAIGAATAARRAGTEARILLILDIDNTLLTMPQYLGGDRWFNHHAARIAIAADRDFNTMNDLIAMQTALFGLAAMDATQTDIVKLLADAADAGVDTFLLSARGPDLYDATRRELDRNGIRFVAPKACAFFLCNGTGLYRDSDIRSALRAIGTPPSSQPYRSVLIRDGVMLTAGQDKGVMLKLLMGAIGGLGYTRVIVADDGRKNIDAFAASRNPVPLSLFHYRRIDTAVSEAEDQRAHEQLSRLRKTLCSAVRASICPTRSAPQSIVERPAK